MREKHYVPEIGEFQIGFEYEITNGYEWVKKTFAIEDLKSFLYESLNNGIEQGQIRVKHLDKDDIESLWFKANESMMEYRRSMFTKDVAHHASTNKGLLLILLCSNDWTLISFTENPGAYVMELPDEKLTILGGTLFAGYIKNKSELKRILKQIGFESTNM
jgi:hypothetical protein